MLGNLGNIAEIMKSAKAFQGNLAKLQEELAARRYEAESGGGMVRATVDGKSTLMDIRIDPNALGDRELLEDLIKAAVCAAIAKSQEAMKSEMAALTGGMNISGLTEMLGGGATGS